VPVPTARLRRPRRAAAALLAAVAATAIATGCGSDDASSGDRPEIVVTTTMLGAVVQDLVGDAAEVQVLMPDGVDPHDFQPSARDAAALGEADLVVQNGLDLEEGLEDAIGTAEGDGVAVFSATDHVTLREFGEGERSDEEHAGEGEAEHGPEDPHIWMDPIAMRDVALALAPVLSRDLGLDVTDRSADLDARLEALDAEIRESLSVIPEARRKLVTGHESMGYFADRYDFTLIGALIPSLSSQSQVSASNLADLRAVIEREDVPAIFNETGTPEGVADAIGDQTGARVVEISSHTLPDDGSYFTFMRDVAAAVEDGLTKGS
jgi:zinc/manganese transport system substrate-binding protein